MTDRNSDQYGPMNPEAQEKLEEIVVKEVAALSKSEIEFLRARRIYLTEQETEKYEEALTKDDESVVERQAEVKEAQVKEPEQFDGQADPFKEAEKVLELADADVAELTPYRELLGRAKQVKLRTIGMNHRQLQQRVLEAEAKAQKGEAKPEQPKKDKKK